MAKIKIGSAMPEYGWFEDFYHDKSLKLVDKSAGKAVIEDKHGASIELFGSDLKFSGGDVIGGKVTGVRFRDEHGGILINITEGHYNAEKLFDTLQGNGGVWDMMTLLTAGDDKIYGRNGKGDYLNIGNDAGNDIIVAGDSGSFIGGSKGADTLTGGSGWDTLSYDETYFRGDDFRGIKANLATGVVIDSWGDKDKVSNFEQLCGSVYADTITGSKRDDVLIGVEGKDHIDGGKGEDEVRYQTDVNFGGGRGIVADLSKGAAKDGFGNKDTLISIERVTGTFKADTFIGDSHDNSFRGLSGKDSFDGNAGGDTIIFSYWEDIGQHGIKVDLTRSKGQIIDDGFGNTENATSIENISGSLSGDRIRLGAKDGWVWVTKVRIA